MAQIDIIYNNLINDVLENGIQSDDRTGIGTKSVFGRQIRVDLKDEFPILTTKKINFNLPKTELLWFIHGDTNIQYLLKNGNKIWVEWPLERYFESAEYSNNLDNPDMKNWKIKRISDPEFNKIYLEQKKKFEEKIIHDNKFAEKYGSVGPTYGKQWRNFGGVDQLEWLISEIKNNPNSRRLILSMWNPADMDEIIKMSLPPCPCFLQFNVRNNKLNLSVYQRSADLFLGVPFDLVDYGLLTHLIALETGLEVGELIYTFGDLHIYNNHFDAIKTQLSREPKSGAKLRVNKFTNIFDIKPEDIELIDYDPHPFIAAQVAV